MRLVPTRDTLLRDLRTVVLAVATCSVVMAAPSVASKLRNADTVDHLSAVGAGSSVAHRAGKLVATDKDGLLPSNIVKVKQTPAIAPTAKPGSVQTGLWSAWGGGGDYTSDAVTFVSKLPAMLPLSRTTYITNGGAYTAECPGPGRVGPVGTGGWACLYEHNSGGQTYAGVFQADVAAVPDGISPSGFGIYYSCTDAACYSYGGWAVKAPVAGSGRAAPRAAGPVPR